MTRRALSYRPGRRTRRASPRTPVLLALLLAWVALALPASVAAASADAYEPDGTYATAKAITVDAAAQQHTVYPEGDQDWVSFPVSAGLTYVIETAAGTPTEYLDTVLALYDANGTTLIASNDDSDYGAPYSRIVYTANADKTVFARITCYYADNTGTYALSVRAAGDSFEPDGSAAAATPITVGGVAQQHTVDPDGDEDWVSFAVSAGLTYKVATGAGTPPASMEIVLNLYDANGLTKLDYGNDYYYDEASWGDERMEIVYTADADKTIYARASGWGGGQTGSYALSVAMISDPYEPDGLPGTAKPVTADGTLQQHTLVPGDDEDWVSFSVLPGWGYTVETSPGSPAEATETGLVLFDSDGTTEIAQGEYLGTGYERIVYRADAAKTVYARARMYAWSDGTTYALSVTGVPLPRIDLPGSADYGDVPVGASRDRIVVVSNTGAGALTVGTLQLEGAGFSIVGDEASGAVIPPGESREVVVRFSPSVARTGPPVAVEHDWTTLVAHYNYSGGTRVSVTLYAGFQNEGGAGDLPWRVRIGTPNWTGTGTVVAGGRYIVETLVSAGTGSLVELLQPVSESFNVPYTGTSVLGVTYVRVPDAFLTIPSDDPDVPEEVVGLFGVALPAGTGDVTAPTTGDDYDDAWHSTAVTVDLTATDDLGGSGMVGGQAQTEYSKDGGATWTVGTSVTYAVWKRGGGSGLHTLLYRSTDAAGNVEETRSCEVKIDARAPLTADDAPSTPRAGTVTVHLTAADSLVGVTACSGVASVTYSLDGGAPQTVPGAAATVPVSGVGTHWIRYYATDNAGNVAYPRWCAVTITAARSDRLPVRTVLPR